MSLVLLGGAVLAAVDIGWHQGPSSNLAVAVLVGMLAFAASIAWGLGLSRIGLGMFIGIAAIEALTLASGHGRAAGAMSAGNALVALAPLTSAFLLGTSLAAMLLGHHYLTAPSMTIEPLKRLVALTGWALFLRALIALGGLWFVWSDQRLPTAPQADLPILLAMRWLVGLAAPALAIFLAWRTALIRSTQSATGILYAGCTLILLGELAAQGLSATTGVPF
jgi:hypothetical protein